MTKGKYYDYLERYNHMASNDYMYKTDNETDFRNVKASLLKHIDWQLKSMTYDLDKYNSLKMLLHKRKYQKLLRNIHDMKEIREKIEKDKPIDLMYFTGTYRGAMSGIADDIFSSMKVVWIPIIVLIVIYLIVAGIFYYM